MRDSFLNTFEKGLNKDYSIILQPDGTYRHMVNCSLISQDGNNYTVKDCLGNTKIFTINPPYFGTPPSVGALPIPILFISFPNKLVVLSTNNETDGTGYGQIGVINYLPYGEGIKPVAVAGNMNDGYVPLYHSDSLHFSKRHRAEGFGYEENELISRIYWTDNYNEPRTFNVSDPIFTTYIASGSLIAGEFYMVVEGAISYNGTSGLQTYAPGLGNVFEADATTTYTDLAPGGVTAKVIKYYPVELLNFNPSRSLGTINYVKYGSGNLYCGNKIYFYRLTRSGVPNTSWSYGSWAVHVGTQNEIEYLTSPTIKYQNFVGGGTTSVLKNSGKSVFMLIDNIDTNYDYVELACAEFDQSDEAPRMISIVAREEINGATSVTLEHDGTVNLGILTLADITLFPASILRAKTIATNKNYNIIGNITERSEFDFDTSATLTYTRIHYPMNCHDDPTSCSLSDNIYTPPMPTNGTNPAAGTVTPWSRWLVTSVAQPIYNGTAYPQGSIIVGVTGAGNDSIDFATNPGSTVVPCVTKNKYDAINFGGARRENATEISSDPGGQLGFWNYKDPTVHFNMKGYWGGETYRFGILFYDKKGNPFYVKHLFDYQIPKNQVDGIIRSDEIGNTGEYVYSLNPSLISISGLKIPLDILDQISGFSIVRAERNANAVCQGLVAQCVNNGASPNIYFPGAWIPHGRSLYSPADKVYMFLSPDLLDDSPLPGSVGNVGDIMESASWVTPFEYDTNIYVRGVTNGSNVEAVYSKLIDFGDADNVDRSGVIEFWGDVVEQGTLTGFPSGVTLENVMQTAAANVDVNGDCSGGDYNLNSHNAVGCKKAIFTLSEDFLAYGEVAPAGALYTEDVAASLGNPTKLLMNYTKAGGATPYGALSDTLYISTGHFQPITAQVIADTTGGGFLTFNNIEIAGGDCFTCLVDIGYGLWKNAVVPYSYAWTFPCECNSNYELRRGRKTSNTSMYFSGTTQSESMVFLGPSGEIRLEEYQYNPGYNAGAEMVKYPALPADFVNGSQFKARLRWSNLKFIGEATDSFREFSLLDFRDLSVQNGRINNIKVKEDKVVVWQDLAVNTVPILERQVISGTSGDATTIGTGGVIDRFDILTSYFGNQHQWGVTECEFGFIWFDMHRKGMVVLGFDGTGLLEPTLVLGLQGFFNEVFVEALGTNVTADKLLNSPTFADTSDMPLMGTGITGGYDPKFKVAYMTFKFKQQNATGYKAMDFTISYLHTALNKMFVSFHDWTPAIYHTHNLWMMACNNPKTPSQYLPDSATLTNYSFVVGETLQGNDSASRTNTEYICIQDVTLDSIIKYPLGAAGSTFWLLVNATNQIWVWNQPTTLGQTTAPDYQYNKAFGKVYDNEITLVVNPNKYQDQSFYVSNIEQIGPHNVNYTSIYYEAGNQAASDVSITGTNRNYRFIFDKICSNIPFSTVTNYLGRIINRYLQIRFVKHNYTTNPTSVTTSVKILQSVKSFLNLKR